MSEPSHIACPNCGFDIDVNEILVRQLEGEIRQKYQDQIAAERKSLQSAEAEVLAAREAIKAEQAALQERVAGEVQKGLREQKRQLEVRLRESITEENAEAQRVLKEELERKSAEVKELNKTRAEMERLKRENAEQREKIEAEMQSRLNSTLTEERDRIRKDEVQRAQMTLRERDQLITQLKDQVEEMKRKAEQGSMQLQGEVQELAIEAWLAEQFPLDTIEEIKKGQRGGDCLQVVNTHARQNCGAIYYESKRTKSFQPAWIEKFKADIRERNADIGVLVTDAMPGDMERLGLKDGIWICSFDEFKSLCVVLRDSLVRVSNAVVTQENKGEKMGLLYDFLTSTEFRLQVEAIVEGFSQMKSELDAEKRAMANLWKKREKQLDKVLLNTTHMYGSIRGIAGSAVQPVQLLELDPGDSTDDAE